LHWLVWLINCKSCTVHITKYIDFTADGKNLLLHFKPKYYSLEQKHISFILVDDTDLNKRENVILQNI